MKKFFGKLEAALLASALLCTCSPVLPAAAEVAAAETTEVEQTEETAEELSEIEAVEAAEEDTAMTASSAAEATAEMSSEEITEADEDATQAETVTEKTAAASETGETEAAAEDEAAEDTAEIAEITEAEEETEAEAEAKILEQSLTAVCGGVTFTLTGKLPSGATFHAQEADTQAAQERILAASEDEILVTAAYELELSAQDAIYSPEGQVTVSISGLSKDRMLYVLTGDRVEEQENALSVTMEQGSCILAYAQADIPEEVIEDYGSSSSSDYQAPVTVTYHQTDARSMLPDVNSFRTSGTAWYWNSDDTTKTTGVKSGALKYDYDLEKIAMQRAAEICYRFSHERPDDTLYTTAYDSSHWYRGENIAAGYDTASDAFSGWKEEDENYDGQGHRRNMLNNGYTAIGIACAEVNGVKFWVQELSADYVSTSDPGACDSSQTRTLDIADAAIYSASVMLDGTRLSSSGTTIAVDSSHSAGMEIMLVENWGGTYVDLPSGYLALISDNTSILATDGSSVTGTGVGTANLTVKTTMGTSATATIRVGHRVTGISLNKTSGTLPVDCTLTLTATLTPSDAGNQNVIWSTSDSSVATVSDGKVNGISKGNVVITATSEDGGYTAVCTLYVGPKATSVTAEDLTVNVGSTKKISVKTTPADAAVEITYPSGNDAYSVDSSGNVTGKKPFRNYIVFSYISGNAWGRAACLLTVVQPVTGVALDQSSLLLNAGNSQFLGANVSPLDASNKTVTWSSSNTAVATVDGSGLVTARAAGTAAITVTTEDGGKTAVCQVAVRQPVTGISLDPCSLSLNVGDSRTLAATVSPSNASNKNVTWTSSDAAVATVDNQGLVTAKAAGTAGITVTTEDGGRTATCTVTVNEKETSSETETEETQVMYRLYNPNSGEHFYTANAAEKDHLVSLGWNDESIGWIAPVTSDTPVYRLYNANGGEHHYTTSAGERDNLVNAGWSYEGIGWYSDDQQRVPLYRQYNPNAFANNHNYTYSTGERDHLVGLGWKDEDIGWYGVAEK